MKKAKTKPKPKASAWSIHRWVRRPPCAVMTISAAVALNSKVPRKLAKAGYEIVVVPDKDFDRALKAIERVRRKPPNNEP